MDMIQTIAQELQVKSQQVEAAVQLIDEGNTIPFIARYRKEATGALNDEQLRQLHERLLYLRNLEEKKAQALGSIEEQGKLTPELKKQILAAQTLVMVEDLYRPYRPKRRTRATIAKEKGLEPLAVLIWRQALTCPVEEEAKAFLSEEKEVRTVEEAVAGASDILAEQISEEADYRIHIRDVTQKKGIVRSQAKNKEAKSVYEMYYDFEEPVSRMAGHRIMALNRGEKEKVLQVKLAAPEEDLIRYLEKKVITKKNPHTTPLLKDVVADSYKRLIAPAVEREIRAALTEKAEDALPDPAFGKILHQQTVKRLQATFGHTFFERCVHVHEKGMLLLTVDLDIQFQHRIHLDDPLLPVRIWLHIQTLVDHTDLHIGDHLHPAALALHLLIKWQGVLQPLQRISLLIPPVEQKDKQFAFDQDLIFLRTDIHPPHLHRAPEHLGDVWFIGGQGDLLLHPYRILFMYAQPQDFHRLLFHGDLLRAQSGRQRQLHQFIHNGKK